MFISFEGIDGAGKSTLSAMVAQRLREKGTRVFLTREPTDAMEWTDLLKKGRDPVSGLKLFFRFTEDRMVHQEEISSHVSSGEVVVCDRYLMSSLAYQGALLEPLFEDRNDVIRWMLSVSEIISIRPDITFYLDVDPETSMQRLESRKALTGFEEAGYLKRVRDFYRTIDFEEKITLDGSRSLHEVFEEIMSVLEGRLRQ